MKVEFVESLPDLISPEEYAGDPNGQMAKLRIRVTATGVEILGDAVDPIALEALLAAVGVQALEQMLCG